MGMHIWNGSAWKAINQDGGNLSDRGLIIWNGSSWGNAANAKVWNGSVWKGFLDNITLNDDNVSYSSGGSIATVQWVVALNGYIQYTNVSGNTVSQYQWNLNTDNNGQYDVKVDLISGAFDAGSSSTGTWLSCGSVPQTWNLSDTSGLSSVSFTAQIRNAITQEVLSTGSIFMSAIASSGGGGIGE
jgi:D-aminopeptidase